MAGRNGRRAADGDTRDRLMAATAAIIREEGYAAATSRRVAERAGVRSALVYYYFPTMDDLYLAVMRTGAEHALARMRKALSEQDPLRALWVINSEDRFTQLNTEFMALANHRKVIGAELRAYAERVRDIETAAVTLVLRAHGVDTEAFPPVAMSMLLTGAARMICNESAVGMTQGHEELRAFVERFLEQYRMPTVAGPAPTATTDTTAGPVDPDDHPLTPPGPDATVI
ncbi:MAG TPA: helix-turn-helix domain-containing protein [Nocardia sp.]|uniref:TetR/AcrR family transcriptional regulator n=1 Tax=Nocardia TaxID=1817 RepID=UPI00245478B5|nr:MULTISPECIES: helix-turn-helix domain-containing protein [Nocardia]HLS79756.1 helix-turn-helix domain-containing protein [Nocardia sp.]